MGITQNQKKKKEKERVHTKIAQQPRNTRKSQTSRLRLDPDIRKHKHSRHNRRNAHHPPPTELGYVDEYASGEGTDDAHGGLDTVVSVREVEGGIGGEFFGEVRREEVEVEWVGDSFVLFMLED